VLLAEVTLDSEDTFGVDFSFSGAGSRDFGGFTRAEGSGVLTAIGVPNLSVSSLDFDLLIRALQVQGRLEVLSRPQILVNDNELANIEVGEEIRLVTTVNRTDEGGVNSDVEPRSVGVLLSVTPSISPDGFVRLDISPEISAVTTRTTQVSEDFEAPIITQRRADTTVTVKDGETIVLGGLIQNSLETRRSKVPVLGDIPVVGEVFRTNQTSSAKTELLIILTPRVILSEADLAKYSAEEIDRLSLPESTKNELRRNNISPESTLFVSPELPENGGKPKTPGAPPEDRQEPTLEPGERPRFDQQPLPPVRDDGDEAADEKSRYDGFNPPP
jgi:general secretion pathway protein D